MKDIVKYNNYLNSLVFKDFTAADYDFFMYLCSAMRDKGTEEMSFSSAELRECTGYGHKGTIEEFNLLMDGMNAKLLSMRAHLETSTELVRFVLFPTFRINKQTGVLTVRVNKDFQFLLNELVQNFTQFELLEFTALNSKYSKVLYRLLKQFRSTGEYHVKAETLRKLLGCPEGYTNKQLMQSVISPAVKELQNEFPLLQCETIRARTKGRPVTGYYFTFKAEDQVPGQMTIDEGLKEVQKYKKQKAQERKQQKPYLGGFMDFEQREYDDSVYQEIEEASYREHNK